MNCPICSSPTIVLETRGQDRRRECRGGCGHRFTTTEILKEDQLRQEQAVRTVIEAAEKLKAEA
jgi:transcriptional regulator NrdR family protein